MIQMVTFCALAPNYHCGLINVKRDSLSLTFQRIGW